MPWNEKIDIWNIGVLVCVNRNTGLGELHTNYSVGLEYF